MDSDQLSTDLSSTPSLKSLAVPTQGSLLLSSQNLLKLPSDSDSTALSLVVTTKSMFLGFQKWELASEDTSISQSEIATNQIYSFVNPHVQITKANVAHFSIWTQVGNEQHSLITSGSKERFLEFYLWSKRKYDNSETEGQKILKLSEKQKVNLNIDQITLCANKDVIQETSEVAEEVIRMYKIHEERLKDKINRLTSFSAQESPKDSVESITLKQKVVRFH